MTVNIIATLFPKAGKEGRVLELLKEVAKYIEAHEPTTLGYQIHSEKDRKSGAVKVILVESYKDMDAVKIHGASDEFKAFNKKITGEDLMDKKMLLQFVQHEGGFARSKL